MNCPNCGKQMEYGHLAAGGYRILWTRKEVKMSGWPGGDDILLQNLNFGKNKTRAWLCRQCRKILVDY